MTNAEAVSRLLGSTNSLSKDDRISRRLVLSILRGKAEHYISTKLSERSLFREDNLYSVVDCFEMEKEDVMRCDIIEFRRCRSIMKSTKRLPKLIYSKYGSSLKEITTLDDERDFKFTTPSQFRRDKNRAGKDDYIRYYVKDGYLYLLDTEVESVNLYLLTLETDKLEDLSSCSKKDTCKSLWEYDFIYPSKLEEVIFSEALKELMNRKGIPQDTNPNLDSNQKGKTIQ